MTDWGISRPGGGLSLRELLLPRRRNRRSRERLSDYRAPAAPVRASVAARPRAAVQISAGAALNLALALALACVLVWFFASDRFYVNQIIVNGNQRVSTEAIALASGIRGYSIFWVNGRQVAEAVTAALPPIRAVQVRYGLPNKVVLTVEEQGEQVMWLSGGQRYWVDQEGGFHPATGGDDPALLVRDLRAGTPMEVDPEALLAARALAAWMPELTAVDYVPDKGLHFQHERGWLVYLGIGEDMGERVRVYRTLEAQFLDESAQQPVLVDVRFPKPYYRLAGQ
ncbi:MAG: FtsQ-type POTRA domain-containing protein [Anaerolineae bacterium]|nr:FtsQ-type POTRA domain-containing protein [Anaerolineae bacterium]